MKYTCFLFGLIAIHTQSIAAPTARINVTQAPYSAQCNGVTDDSSALQSAINAAQSNGAVVYIPAGANCKYSATLALPPQVNLIGEGHSTSKLSYCGAAEAIKISAVNSDNEGHLIKDLTVQPCVEGGGTYGIHVQIVTGTYAYFNYDSVRIGGFGARAIWLNNNADRQDGFFMGKIAKSVLKNGLLGQKIGDSIAFEDVKFYGKNNVDISGMPKNVPALGVMFRGGQITTENGFLILRNMDSVRIHGVWMEGNPTQAGWTADSAVQLDNCADVLIDGAMIAVPQNAGAAPYQSIGMTGSTDTKIRNTVFLNRGSAAHIYGTNTTVRTKLDTNLFVTGRSTPAQSVVVLQGS